MFHLKYSEEPLVQRLRIVFAEHQNSPIVTSPDRFEGRVEILEISRHDVVQVGHEPAAQVGFVVLVEIVRVQEVVLKIETFGVENSRVVVIKVFLVNCGWWGQ